jgi:hypothetical protein
MKCLQILNHFRDSDGVNNTVVHADVAKALIELKFDMQRLTERVLNPGIKVQAIKKKEAGKQSLIRNVYYFNFQLPIKTHEALCELKTKSSNYFALVTKLMAVLSLFGSNKGLKLIRRRN